MQEQIERDLKAAMLAGDKIRTEILRGLKSSLQYEAVNIGAADRKLSDEQVQKILARESKKRQETAEIYNQKGETAREAAELSEKEIIDNYLPEQLSDDQLKKIIDEEISKVENPTIKDLGKIIAAVRARAGASADGALIAKLVKETIQA